MSRPLERHRKMLRRDIPDQAQFESVMVRHGYTQHTYAEVATADAACRAAEAELDAAIQAAGAAINAQIARQFGLEAGPDPRTLASLTGPVVVLLDLIEEASGIEIAGLAKRGERYPLQRWATANKRILKCAARIRAQVALCNVAA